MKCVIASLFLEKFILYILHFLSAYPHSLTIREQRNAREYEHTFDRCCR